MRILLIALALTVMTAVNAKATGELDNEALVTNEQILLAQDLPATLVIRVKAGSENFEVFQSATPLNTDTATLASVHASPFTPMTPDLLGELDRDSSQSSWYLAFPLYNWSYPGYYYHGYYYGYSSYYQYSWGGYSYYYYGWSYRW